MPLRNLYHPTQSELASYNSGIANSQQAPHGTEQGLTLKVAPESDRWRLEGASLIGKNGLNGEGEASMTVGRPRAAMSSLAGYSPGKSAAQAEREHGIANAIKLASNESPWPPIPAVTDAIKAAAAGVNRYGDNTATEVREAIARWIDIAPDQISVGCGSSGVLQQLMLTYVDPGDEVVTPWASFEIYPVFCNLFDAKLVRVPLVNFGFDLDAVAEAVGEKTKIVFLATPNNPTGTSVATTEIERLVRRIPDDVIVVIDEAYREFNDPRFGDPVKDLVPKFRNVVVTRTFSKAYGLAGLRTGYGIGDTEVISMIDRVRLAFSVNNLAQAATLAAIEHDGENQSRVDVLIGERERLATALQEVGAPVVEGHANFVFLATGARSEELARELETMGLVVRPFPDLGLRITVSDRSDNNRVIAALGELL